MKKLPVRLLSLLLALILLPGMSAALAELPDAAAQENAAAELETTGETEAGEAPDQGPSVAPADGDYTPDRFSFSGGSGRVTITCPKVTVKNGKATATIVFSSPNYPYVKAGGQKIQGSHTDSTSAFEIPIELNANNRILGMTTAMSNDHEVEYTLYVYLRDADAAAAMDDAQADDPAPQIPGVKLLSRDEITDAALFAIYRYEGGLTVIRVEGVADYLLAPGDAELPLGIDEEMTIIRQPVEAACIADEALFDALSPLEVAAPLAGFAREGLINAGTCDAPAYAALLGNSCDLAIMPAQYADIRVTEDEKAPTREALTDEAAQALKAVTGRFGLLGVPLFVDRSADEATEAGRIEWLRAYGAILGCEDAAAALIAQRSESLTE